MCGCQAKVFCSFSSKSSSLTSLTTADPGKVLSSQSPVLSFSIKILESVANATCLHLLAPIYFPFHCNLLTLANLPVIS